MNTRGTVTTHLLLCLAALVGSASALAGAQSPEVEPVELQIVVKDPEGEPVSVGRIHVGRELPLDPEFHENRDVDSSGRCVFELPPATYGVRWDTADSLRPVRVEVNGAPIERYPNFVKTNDSGEDGEVRVISGRVVGAEVVVESEPVTVAFIVPSGLERNRVRGEVLDNSARPVAGLRFALYRGEAMNCARCAVTEEDGRFNFISRKFPIRLVPRDYTGLWDFVPEEVTVAGPEAGTLKFRASPRTAKRLHGATVDAEGGAPVADVWVEYEQACVNEWAEGRVRTDEEGRFAVSCHPGCAMSMKLRHQDFDFDLVETSLPPHSCDEELTVEMNRR